MYVHSHLRKPRLKTLGRSAAIGVTAVALFAACAPQEPARPQAAPATPLPISPPVTSPRVTAPAYAPAPPTTAYRNVPAASPQYAPRPLQPSAYQSTGDVDCPDVGREVWVGNYDPYNLDADGDGWGCELQGDIEDSRNEVDDLLSELDYDSPLYDDADELYSSLDDVQTPDDLDDFYNNLDDLRSDIEDYDE